MRGRALSSVNVCAWIIFVFNFVMTRWMAPNWILRELLLDEKLSSVTQAYISLGCMMGNYIIPSSWIFWLDVLQFFVCFSFLVFLARNQQQITIQLCEIKLYRSHNYTISYSRLMDATISGVFFPICIFPEPRIIIFHWIDFNKMRITLSFCIRPNNFVCVILHCQIF